jgi:hypothetical protein
MANTRIHELADALADLALDAATRCLHALAEGEPPPLEALKTAANLALEAETIRAELGASQPHVDGD